AFSFSSICWRAASHSFAETTLVFMAELLLVAMLVAGFRRAGSGRQPLVIFPVQPAPALPERFRLLAVGAGNQDIEMHVPAGADLEQGRAIGQTAMDHGEQHALASGLQLEGDVAASVPSDRKLAERLEFGDAALHPVLFGKTFRP